MDGKVPVPAHVPADRVVDVNYKALPGAADDVMKAWSVLAGGPDVVWSPYNGGHWMVTTAAALEEAMDAWQLFSSTSNAIPSNEIPNLPLEVDPPIHTPLRAILSPLFAPATLLDIDKRARALAGDLIDGFAARGQCEFVEEFAKNLPIQMFLSLVDIPMSDAPWLLEIVELRVRSSDGAVRDRVKRELIEYLKDKIEYRRANPGDDWISKILQGTIDGRRLTEFEEQNLLTTVLFGGLDTVASMLGFVMAHLARSPAHRAQLAAEPKLVPKAVNEYLRAYGIVANARIVLKDGEFRGVQFKAGDRMLIPTPLGSLDETRFPDPWTIDYNRPNASAHMTFGAGPHRCAGANLARTEIRITIEEWLKRIPDFRIAPGEDVVYGAGGVVSSVNRLVLEWDRPPAA